MLTIEHINPTDKRQVGRFVDVSFRLYRDCPQWVPPIRGDVALALNRARRPFHEHSAADFFLAVRDSRDVGRIAALENVNYNRQHGTRAGQHAPLLRRRTFFTIIPARLVREERTCRQRKTRSPN